MHGERRVLGVPAGGLQPRVAAALLPRRRRADVRPDDRDQDRALRAEPDGVEDLRPILNVPRPVLLPRVGRVDALSGLVQMEPSDLHPRIADADALLPVRVYGEHHADADLDVPRPLRDAGLGPVDDDRELVRQVAHEPDKPDLADLAAQPVESDEPYERDGPGSNACPRHAERQCNCRPGSCADDDVGADAQSRSESDLLNLNRPALYRLWFSLASNALDSRAP